MIEDTVLFDENMVRVPHWKSETTISGNELFKMVDCMYPSKMSDWVDQPKRVYRHNEPWVKDVITNPYDEDDYSVPMDNTPITYVPHHVAMDKKDGACVLSWTWKLRWGECRFNEQLVVCPSPNEVTRILGKLQTPEFYKPILEGYSLQGLLLGSSLST